MVYGKWCEMTRLNIHVFGTQLYTPCYYSPAVNFAEYNRLDCKKLHEVVCDVSGVE